MNARHAQLALALAVLGQSLPARADYTEYRRHTELARTRLQKGDRAGAVREYQAAYAASPEPRALFEIAFLERREALDDGKADLARTAIAGFKAYLTRYRAVNNDRSPKDEKTIFAYVAELERRFEIAPEVATPAAPKPGDGQAPVDPCAPPVRAAGEPPPEGRDAVREWAALYAQCPSPSHLLRLAIAREEVARRERSVLLLEQALELYERWLATPGPGGADGPERPEVERRLAELRGALVAAKARPFLEQARSQMGWGMWDRAIASWDEYARAAGRQEDRELAEAEKEHCRRQRAWDGWSRADHARKLAGVSLLGIGIGLGAVGGLLVGVGSSQAASASSAATLGDHDDQLALAHRLNLSGLALGGTGAGLALVGIITLVAQRSEPRLTSLWVAPTGGGILAGGILLMRRLAPVVALAALAIAALAPWQGCTFDKIYPCTDDIQCVHDKIKGSCVPAPNGTSYCMFADESCAGGQRWDVSASGDVAGTCANTTCDNKILDGQPGMLETDIDCGGGFCAPCVDGQKCRGNADCASGICTAKGVCNAPGCHDAVKNGSESDVDCGGPSCAHCTAGQACRGVSDCVTRDPASAGTPGLCSFSHCVTCTDGIRNGDESDVDCGGTCTRGCAIGGACVKDTDCASRNCALIPPQVDGGAPSMACGFSPSCSNLMLDGTETDLDCGGPACPGCADAQVCAVGADCRNHVCTSICQNGDCDMTIHLCSHSCYDHVKNGDESDVDCGGVCPGCPNGRDCSVGFDCTSQVCTAGTCTSSCMDGKTNGTETDTDCGGNCAPCSDGQACLIAVDCTSMACTNNRCQTRCDDGVQNGSELQVDCGGGVCPGCKAGAPCKLPSDCRSKLCTNGTCVGPQACHDMLPDYYETDVDCGGPDCLACAAGKACFFGGDCQSGMCMAMVCK